MSRRRTSRRGGRRGGQRDYPRSARLSQLVHEIAADTLERLDDERLGLLTIQDVYVDSELDRARITYVQSGEPIGGADAFVEGLDDARRAIKREVGRQAHIRRTPEVELVEDAVIESASHVEEILRGLRADGELE